MQSAIYRRPHLYAKPGGKHMTGAVLREIRQQLGLRQVDVAEALGVAQRTVSAAERAGRVRPRTVARYVAAFTTAPAPETTSEEA